MSGNPDRPNQTDDGLSGNDAAADRETRIRERAYYRWIREGLPVGRDYEHWFQAEKEADAEQYGQD